MGNEGYGPAMTAYSGYPQPIPMMMMNHPNMQYTPYGKDVLHFVPSFSIKSPTFAVRSGLDNNNVSGYASRAQLIQPNTGYDNQHAEYAAPGNAQQKRVIGSFVLMFVCCRRYELSRCL
jgi:hypothetical protein